MKYELPSAISDFKLSIFNLFEATNSMVTSSCIKCKHCGYTSKTENHSTGPISVPLRPRVPKGDLSIYLKNYMEETISDYKCDKCHVKFVHLLSERVRSILISIP